MNQLVEVVTDWSDGVRHAAPEGTHTAAVNEFMEIADGGVNGDHSIRAFILAAHDPDQQGFDIFGTQVQHLGRAWDLPFVSHLSCATFRARMTGVDYQLSRSRA
ncbi:MAG: hypothetical protein ACK47C_07650 [Paracoccaceae bacterium]